MAQQYKRRVDRSSGDRQRGIDQGILASHQAAIGDGSTKQHSKLSEFRVRDQMELDRITLENKKLTGEKVD
jgi:hypothetical protein